MKKLRRLIFIVLLLLVLLALAILIFPSVGGFPLHRYEARLRANGEKLSFQELSSTLKGGSWPIPDLHQYRAAIGRSPPH